MKEQIITFIHNLSFYDYVLFGLSFALFFLFVILAILLRQRLFLALFFFLLSIGILFLGPTLGYVELHKYLFKNSTELISQQRLHFVDAIVVHGVLHNGSKLDFKECKVIATVYRVTPNRWKNYIYRLKPLKRNSLMLENIPKGAKRDFKMFVEPFHYSKEYNLTLGADCR